MVYKLLLCVCATISLCMAHTAFAAIPAQDVTIIDGDTVRVAGKTYRLYGIDCPESGQDFGVEAKEILWRIVEAANSVTFEYMDTDRYGRTVAIMYVDQNGWDHDVQTELLLAGAAWVFPKYCRDMRCIAWAKTMQDAKKSRIGLWSEEDPVPPWEWRKREK